MIPDSTITASAIRVAGIRSVSDLDAAGRLLRPAQIAVDGCAQGIPPGRGCWAGSGQMAAESGPVPSEGCAP